MDKILFIGSLNTKKDHFDGERIKTTLTRDVLKEYFNVVSINLSTRKMFKTARFIFCLLFCRRKYKYVVISKDRGGAKLLHKILYYLKFDMSRVIYFQIGPFLYDIVKNNESVKRLFCHDKIITVETESLKKQLNSICLSNVFVMPNFKPIPILNFVEHHYPKNELRLVYFSRVEEMKGIYQLIDTLAIINENKIRFSLDIFGLYMSKYDKERIANYLKKYSWLHYMGTISLDSSTKYNEIQVYDLHVFPTMYGEGFPGTIIDFFIAGVPTLSSNFARSSEILTPNESIIFEQGDSTDLQKKLTFIYNNQNILNNLRLNAFNRRSEYGMDVARLFIEKEILKNE